MKTERVADLPWDGVYVLRSAINCRSYGEQDLLHIMSKHRGGEVRGYRRATDSSEPWQVRLPAHEGHWPEMDQAVANAMGERVLDLTGRLVLPQARPLEGA